MMPKNVRATLMPSNKNYQEGYAEGHVSGKIEGARTMAKNLIRRGTPVASAVDALRVQFPEMEEEMNNVYLWLLKEFEAAAGE
jgi:hypothetical protein